MGWRCGNCGASEGTELLPDGRIDCPLCDHVTDPEPTPRLIKPQQRRRRDTDGPLDDTELTRDDLLERFNRGEPADLGDGP